MEFLFEYLLFFAKVFTVIIGAALLWGALYLIKKNASPDKSTLVITPLNNKNDDNISRLNEALGIETKKGKKEKSNTIDVKDKPRAFVLNFKGDIKASDCDHLAESISVVLTKASSNDEVILKLESPGGIVNNYGLAASQLLRLTSKCIPLTVCVDRIAASGGYMMACTANKIVAAPFAIIGSIGVVASLPNFNGVLKKLDIEYEEHTAGELKRTLTTFGENSDEQREHFKAKLNNTHDLFKNFVKKQRPHVSLDDVANGDHWFANDAINLNLVDELSTSEQYIQSLNTTHNIVEISHRKKKTFLQKIGLKPDPDTMINHLLTNILSHHRQPFY